jgi:hypothetical protein
VFFREYLLAKLAAHHIELHSQPLSLFTGLKFAELIEEEFSALEFAFLMLVKSVLSDLNGQPAQYALPPNLLDELRTSKPRAVAQACQPDDAGAALWGLVAATVLPDWERRGL